MKINNILKNLVIGFIFLFKNSSKCDIIFITLTKKGIMT